MSAAPASVLAHDPVLVQVERGGMVEGVHHGRVAVTDAEGRLLGALGAVDAPMYPRSTVKALQVIAMLENGLDLTGELLALAGASHSGEPFHIAGVERVLAEVGLDPAALQNTADLPWSEAARADWIKAGRGPEPIAMNCSGKHAAMLRTCAASAWDRGSYLAPEHPLQRAIGAVITRYTGEQIANLTVDGCGAPLAAVSLAGLARAFGRVAAATAGPARQIADAYRAHPAWMSGTDRVEAALHPAAPGLICKSGAEAVFVGGLPDGRGIAVKVDDGAERAAHAVFAQILLELGFEHPAVTRLTARPVLGHGQPVGAITPVVDSFVG